MDGITIAVSIAILLPFLGSTIASFLYLVDGYRLYRYLKTTNYRRWRDLTTFYKNPSNYFHPLKLFRYIYGELDNEDEQILRYKDSLKKHFRMSINGMLGVIAGVVFAIFIITKFGAWATP